MTLSATLRRTGLLLLGDIDHAAAAFADLLQQLVAPERLADGFVGSIGEIGLDRGAARFGLRGQHRFGLCMRGEERFKAGAQGGIGSTLAVKKHRALGGRFRQCQLEQEFFASGIHVQVCLNGISPRIDNR